MTNPPSTLTTARAEEDEPTGSDAGYQKTLANFQIQMIAFGGAIGVGLFLGSAGALSRSGPGLVFAYALAGISAFFVMRALGELVLYKPTSGSFVVYAREFIGPWAGYACGWMYWLNWAMTGVAELTAVGIYMHYWFPGLPQWLSALVALGVLLGANVVSVKVFGTLETWFALCKVLAIVVFLVVAVALLATHAGIGHQHAGWANVSTHGGLLPKGMWAVLVSLQSVVFAYAAIELVGITAGETAEPRKIVPKAVRAVIWRIAVFYVGSIGLLVVVLPWTMYHEGESPFVTVFSMLGVPGVGGVMNFVVLTAALSSTNSGLYSTGRVLRALAERHEAPQYVSKMNSRGVPYGGIMLTATVYLAGVLLNLVVPSRAFDIATSTASLGVLTTWATILVCQARLKARSELPDSPVPRPAFRMPGSPWTNYGTLVFLAGVLVLMADSGSERPVLALVPLIVLVLWVGWRAIKRRFPVDAV
ncbi:amino acid permease [Catenulispora pinisilvae]|uniref:amino acid permease n=1 Tax=Catenulispora pinisilvae TaxID=2705253 RepID=UPI001E431A66|nr:amino acid permease [Catenulispora pinisilvae]